jgi:NADH:ubiquinone oxidoreductase subunit
MSLVGTKIYSLFFGTLVGKDELGNRYYKSKSYIGFRVGKPNSERRWVIYNGLEEPSKISQKWHGWLHHIDDKILNEASEIPFIEEHQANLTGTTNAYQPSGLNGKRDRATGDYSAWKP